MVKQPFHGGAAPPVRVDDTGVAPRDAHPASGPPPAGRMRTAGGPIR
jgi:hypothetical protein